VRDGGLAGWGVIRPCRNGRKIGPLVADSRATAELVLSALLASVGGGEVFLDVPGINRDAVGTQVFLTYQEDGKAVRQMREVQIANGFSAQGDRRLLFGLGTRPGPAEVAIFWCGATEPQKLILATGRYHTVSQK